MGTPEIGGRAPIPVEVVAGETYWWCACGRSQSQPFCDGSHEVTEFEPIEYKAEKSGKVFFCTCKRSKRKPTCDGTHKTLV